MTTTFRIMLALNILALGSCGSDSKGTSTSEQPKANSAQPTSMPEPSSSPSDDGIVGEWKLALEAYDDNNNKVLDDEEKKKGISNRHYYRFNADGTCLIHMMKFKGNYEIKETNGRKQLLIYIDDNGTKTSEGKFYILSVNKDELTLLHSSGEYVFWVFKRE